MENEAIKKPEAPAITRDQVRAMIGAITEGQATISVALREAPYRLSRPAFDALEALADSAVGELGLAVVGRCEGCENVIFEDEPIYSNEDITVCGACLIAEAKTTPAAPGKPDPRIAEVVKDMIGSPDNLRVFLTLGGKPELAMWVDSESDDAFLLKRLATEFWEHVVHESEPPQDGKSYFALTPMGHTVLANLWLEGIIMPEQAAAAAATAAALADAPSAIIEPAPAPSGHDADIDETPF